MRKRILTAVCGVLCAAAVSASASAAQLGEVHAKSAILMTDTGQVLFELNADAVHPPASVTKLMTMLLTIEAREAGKAPKREQVAKPTGEGYVPGNGAPGAKGAPKGQPVRVIKIGRNDPCPCGSGLKWKKCTCAKYHPEGSHTEG